MTFLQIEYFLTVARCLSMSEAAKRLYMTQPTLSRQISAMEAELNLPLFYRGKRGLFLTPAGKRLADGLGRILEEYRETIRLAQADNQGISGQLEIGVLDGHMTGEFLPKLLERFQHQYPNIQVNTRRCSFAALAEGLYQRTLDLAITMEFDLEARPGLTWMELEQGDNCLVVQADHPLARLPRPTLADFRNELFIANEPEDTERGLDNLKASCRRAGFLPQFKYAPTLEQYMLWMEAGYGVAVLNERNILSQNPTLRFLHLPELGPSAVVLAWNEEVLSPLVERGIAVSQELISASPQRPAE